MGSLTFTINSDDLYKSFLIGYNFDGNFNHAIIIRSFLSKNYNLHFQAGAGIVSKSNPETELKEINNKLGALNSALLIAEEI